MEAIIERCCGLDVHRDHIEACLLTGKADEKPQRRQRSFGTMSHELQAMAKWLCRHGCTHVAMESTGVYWMAPYKILEPHLEVLVGNAHHLSKVPGRKTDVLDSQWLAELLRHGLIRKSFIPPPPIRELRDLTRYRSKLVKSRSAERNRLQKLLESANIKLASVMSDVFGASGMAMLGALVEGEQSAEEMSKLARGKLRKKRQLLALALDAPFDEHHRYLLSTQLRRLRRFDDDIIDVETRITEKLEPYAEQHGRLTQIPGVSHVVSSVIIAEIGVDMTVFESPEACAAWVGLSPGNNESAGKRKSGRTPRGNQYLKTILVESAQAAVRKKGSYLREKFHRLRARRGYKRALVAIAHKIVLAAYHMLRTGEDYRDLGEGYLDAKNEQRLTKRLVERLEGLGYRVNLESCESVAEARDSADEQEETASTTEPLDMSEGPVRQPAKQHTTSVATAEVAQSSEQDSGGGDVEPVLEASPVQGTPALAGVIVDGDADQSTTAVIASSEQTEARGRDTAQNSATAESSGDLTASPPSRPRPDKKSKRSTRKRATRRSTRPRDERIPPVGTTLTRVYRDVEYRVTVLDDGFEYDGETFSSISGVATVITGTSYSGYQFFRLTKERKGRGTPAAPMKPKQ